MNARGVFQLWNLRGGRRHWDTRAHFRIDYWLRESAHCDTSDYSTALGHLISGDQVYDI